VLRVGKGVGKRVGARTWIEVGIGAVKRGGTELGLVEVEKRAETGVSWR